MPRGTEKEKNMKENGGETKDKGKLEIKGVK
jgi:hypothetical protein